MSLDFTVLGIWYLVEKGVNGRKGKLTGGKTKIAHESTRD
jgi:hypothetical protein